MLTVKSELKPAEGQCFAKGYRVFKLEYKLAEATGLKSNEEMVK
jgi:hypothetical protein